MTDPIKQIRSAGELYTRLAPNNAHTFQRIVDCLAKAMSVEVAVQTARGALPGSYRAWAKERERQTDYESRRALAIKRGGIIN